MQPKNLQELNSLYDESFKIDEDVFAHQRSNILLVAGDHYAQKNSKLWERIRTSKALTDEQKLRITKNNIQRISKIYRNNLISLIGDVTTEPQNEKESQDRKSAELNKSVIADAKKRYKMKKRRQEWAQDFFDIGEVYCKLFWNPNKGAFKGYKPNVDERGQPILGENGQPMSGEIPIYEGAFEIERIFGFNLGRHPDAKSMEDSPVFIVRKYVERKEIEALIQGDRDKLLKVQNERDETYVVFDGSRSKNAYYNSSSKLMLREFYWRPCMEYPNGYFQFTTKDNILVEGELPEGEWPFIETGWDESQTNPRRASLIKQLRPFQVELNRTASKMAEHQVTLGDDKILYQQGSKLSHGMAMPGIRGVSYSGAKPDIVAGRSGEQYLAYMLSQVDEMDKAALLKEETSATDGASNDAFGSLFKSLKQRKKFAMYAEKLQDFEMEFWDKFLRLAKVYYAEDMLIEVVGKSEYVNMSEFKTSEPLMYRINVVPISDDLESQYGHQLMLNHILQYVGGSLDKEAIGKLIKNAPFGNWKEGFDDFTLDYDVAENIVLALDRGEAVLPYKYDNPDYVLKKLTARMRKADYKVLDPSFQQNYERLVGQYEQIKQNNLQQLKQAESEFIPTGGARVKVDYYVPKAGNAAEVERATLPAESVDWLIKQLASQGSTQEQMTQLTEGMQAELAGQFNQAQGVQAAAQGQPALSLQPGQLPPQGPPAPGAQAGPPQKGTEHAMMRDQLQAMGF
jgi:hypothetical protein